MRSREKALLYIRAYPEMRDIKAFRMQTKYTFVKLNPFTNKDEREKRNKRKEIRGKKTPQKQQFEPYTLWASLA